MISKNKLIIYLLILGLISISSISLVSATMEIYGGAFSTNDALDDLTYASIDVGNEYSNEDIIIQIWYSRDGTLLNNGNMVPKTVTSNGFINIKSADPYKYFPDNAEINIYDTNHNLLTSQEVELSPNKGIQTFGIEDFDDSYIKGSSSTTCPSSNSESMKNSYWIDETTSDNQYSADSLATDYDSSYDDTHHDSDKMTDFNNYKEMKDWLSDDWKNDKYLSKSYKESKEYKEIQNRFSVDGVNEKDLIADSTHKIYHKPTCKLISKIPYKHKTRIYRLSNAINAGYKPCQDCIGGSPGYRPLPS